MKNHQKLSSILEYFGAVQHDVHEQSFNIDQQAIEQVYQKNHNDQSLAVKILSILGGLFAGLAFLGFIAITGLFDSDTALLVFGVISIVLAVVINKVFDTILLDTLSVTFYISGFILLIFGLFALHFSDQAVSLIVLVIALLLLFAIRNYLLSFVSILIVNFSFLSLFINDRHYQLISVYTLGLVLLLIYFVLNEAKIITQFRNKAYLYSPIRIGIVVSLLSVLVLYSKSSLLMINDHYIWPSALVIIFTILYLLSKIFNVLDITDQKSQILIYILGFCILMPLLWAPAILGAMFILLLSFYVNHKTGFVLGLISLILFIAQYYYDLNLDLLTKSILMMLSGVLFLLLYFFASKKWGHHHDS